MYSLDSTYLCYKVINLCYTAVCRYSYIIDHLIIFFKGPFLVLASQVIRKEGLEDQRVLNVLYIEDQALSPSSDFSDLAPPPPPSYPPLPSVTNSILHKHTLFVRGYNIHSCEREEANHAVKKTIEELRLNS
jgi:hypothetical protein